MRASHPSSEGRTVRLRDKGKARLAIARRLMSRRGHREPTAQPERCEGSSASSRRPGDAPEHVATVAKSAQRRRRRSRRLGSRLRMRVCRIIGCCSWCCAGLVMRCACRDWCARAGHWHAQSEKSPACRRIVLRLLGLRRRPRGSSILIAKEWPRHDGSSAGGRMRREGAGSAALLISRDRRVRRAGAAAPGACHAPQHTCNFCVKRDVFSGFSACLAATIMRERRAGAAAPGSLTIGRSTSGLHDVRNKHLLLATAAVIVGSVLLWSFALDFTGETVVNHPRPGS